VDRRPAAWQHSNITATTARRVAPSKKGSKPRLLVLIVAYNAEKTISSVLSRVPATLLHDYALEALVIDDSSSDSTFERAETVRRAQTLPFPLHVLFNPENQGYGGNQKIGFHFAIEQGFDFVALVHGDGQYAPECLPELLEALRQRQANAVFGSRMLVRANALKGGMPLYKFAGNILLTAFQNRALRTNFSEFHSGYRVYSTAALRRIPFDLNTNDFHFDTEIIIQFVRAGMDIQEVPIPTYYGDEISYVNGLRYAWQVLLTTLKACAQDLSLFYDRKFDCRPAEDASSGYEPKFDFPSPHSFVLEYIPPGSRVLDLGCAGGHVAAALRRKGCTVTGVDAKPLAPGIALDAFYQHDLNDLPLPVDTGQFDHVLLLDVLEPLHSPEAFVQHLRSAGSYAHKQEIIVSSGNVGFALTRLMLALGQFNYGKRGILDLTHTRLFTFGSLRRRGRARSPWVRRVGETNGGRWARRRCPNASQRSGVSAGRRS